MRKTLLLCFVLIAALWGCKKEETTVAPISRCYTGTQTYYTIQNFGNGQKDSTIAYDVSPCLLQYGHDSVLYDGHVFTRDYDSLQNEHYTRMDYYPIGTQWMVLYGTDSLHYELWSVGSIVTAEKFSGRKL